MKMNQNLRDFSDRHFEVVFSDSSFDPWAKQGRYGKQRLGRFQHYRDASMFQKDVIASLKKKGFHKRAAFPIGWYVTLHGRNQPWNEPDWPMLVHWLPESWRERKV